jgi:hypothetical protein
MGGQSHAPAALPRKKEMDKERERKVGGPQGRSGRERKTSPTQVFIPRTIQPVASRYTDCAIAAYKKHCNININKGDNDEKNNNIILIFYASSTRTPKILGSTSYL